MSGQESEQVVKDLYAAFGRGDIVTVLTLIADDVVWRLPGTVPDYSGTYEGQTSVANFFEKLKSTVEIEGFEPRDFVTEGEHALVTGWSRGESRARVACSTTTGSWPSVSATGKLSNSKSTQTPKLSLPLMT